MPISNKEILETLENLEYAMNDVKSESLILNSTLKAIEKEIKEIKEQLN